MARMNNTRVCSLCGQEKECTTVAFLPVAGKDAVNVKPYTGVRDTIFPGEFYLHACEPRGREKGSNPKKAWISLLLGYVLIATGIAACASVAPSSSVNGLGIFIVFVGWLMAVIAGSVLVFKTRHETGAGGIFLPFFLQFFPFLGLLALAAKAKKSTAVPGRYLP